MHEYCVILAGGSGNQFWPLSREDRPKWSQPARPDGPSFLQQTYDRARAIFPENRIYIVSLSRFRGLLFEQFPDMAEDHLLLEPYGRGTATSIAFAACTLLSRDAEAVMVISPCDHIIEDSARCAETIGRAVEYASGTNALLTLGIVPTSPNTDFGYVQVEGGKDAYAKGTPIKAKTFTEKPSAELAKVFIDSGEFLWNSGIFVWKASAILDEMRQCSPEITKLWEGWEKALGTIRENRFVEKVYTDSPNISIDYAVLEKSRRLYVLPSDFGWSDIGTFNAYYEYAREKDADANMVFGVRGKLLMKDCRGNILCGQNPRKLLAVRGLEDYIVVDTDDVLLVSPRDEATLKDMVRGLNSPEFEEFR